MPKCSDLIFGLERVNQLIDLCIDCSIYKYVDDIIELSRDAQKYIYMLCDSGGKKSLEEFEFPVEKIKIPSTFISPAAIQTSQLFRSKKPPYVLKDKPGTEPLLKNWSDIFWAKRIRAELLCHNKDMWSDRYEELLTFLDSRIPIRKSEKSESENQVDFTLTKFNYLMEQSAVAHSEASHGYAERARLILNKLYKDRNDTERGPYDRWISWNKGVAYQHMVGRNQKAVLEFNWIIRKFWDERPTKNRKPKNIILGGYRKYQRDYFNIVLEFLINIVPAYLQRSAISLKLQLGYHALQTLNKDLDIFLIKIKEDNANNILSCAANYLQQRIDLLSIEALLQLEQLEPAREKLKKINNIFFVDWKPDESYLPKYKEDNSNQKSIKIQLVEQTVSWFMARERAGLCQDNCEAVIAGIMDSIKNETPEDEIDRKLISLTEMAKGFFAASNAIKNTYWLWVKGNQFDELIYFSRWAQFLKHGSGLLKKLQTLLEPEKITASERYTKLLKSKKYTKRLNEASDYILKAIIPLYCAHRKKLPLPTKTVNHRKSLKLERFRSDDRPDFMSGLSAFYKEMCTTSKTKAAQNIFKREKVDSPFDELKADHFNVLDALDEFESEFGENQQISSIKRCNERLIWMDKNPVDDCDKHCIAKQNGLFSRGSFRNLLKCKNAASSSTDKYEFDLTGDNYEKIMNDAEEHFKKNLKSNSCQFPQKEALHFLGLQRWNSLTPAQGRSIGGGYFLYRTDKKGVVDLGIAIDPGFDFVRNLFRMGFSLGDVDIVLISHAHPDHLWDFESMVQLLHELEDKEQITKRLNVIFTLGSYKRLEHIINNPVLRGFINPLVIDIRKEVDPDFFNNLGPDNDQADCFSFRFSGDNCNSCQDHKVMRWESVLPDENNKYELIKIWPTRAYHDDYSERSDSFGFIIQIPGIPYGNSADKPFSFGYSGDTKWVGDDLYNQNCPSHSCCQKNYKSSQAKWKNVVTQYKDCNVLLLHLGSLIKRNDKLTNYTNSQKCTELIRKKNHPYLIGMIRLIRSLYNECRYDETDKLLLISEFGEELRGGIRIDLIKRFQDGLKNDIEKDWRILPVDVGLDILLQDYTSTEKNKTDQNNCSYKFLCVLCEKHCSINEVEYTRIGHDEAIFYICKTCNRAEPVDVRHTKLRKLYEIGRELRTLPDSSQ